MREANIYLCSEITVCLNMNTNKQTKKTNVFKLKPDFDLKLQKPNIPFILMVSWRHRGFLLFLMSCI